MHITRLNCCLLVWHIPYNTLPLHCICNNNKNNTHNIIRDYHECNKMIAIYLRFWFIRNSKLIANRSNSHVLHLCTSIWRISNCYFWLFLLLLLFGTALRMCLCSGAFAGRIVCFECHSEGYGTAETFALWTWNIQIYTYIFYRNAVVVVAKSAKMKNVCGKHFVLASDAFYHTFWSKKVFKVKRLETVSSYLN